MLRTAAVAAAFASLYFLTAKLTGWLSGDSALLWPPSGVYLGVMLVAPRRLWPALACAAGVGSLLTYLHGGTSLELSVAFAVPSSAEGLLAAVLVERITGTRFTLAGVRDLFALVVGGAVVANGLVAISAAAVAAQSFDVSIAESWLRWWSADALGMLAVVPIFTARRRGRRAVALGGLGAALVATHVATDVYVAQGFLAVLLLGPLAFATAAGERERMRVAADHASHELEGSADRLAQLTAELAARSAEVHEATRRRERLAADLRDSRSATERTERKLADARDQLSRVRAESGTLGEELSRARAECGSLGEELSRARAESGALEEELSRARAENGALAEEQSRVTAQNGALEEELSRAGAEHRTLQQEIESVRSEQARISEELAEAVSDRRRAEQELELAAGGLEDVRSELGQSQRAHAQTEQALDKARVLLLEERARLERSLDETTATLARTEAECRLLADHATELIARYDERGTCLYASPASRRLLGYEPDELVGRAGAEPLHPEDRHLLARARATRSESTFEARLRRKAGDYIWVEVLLRPVWARDGDRLVAINATIRDISRHPGLVEPAELLALT